MPLLIFLNLYTILPCSHVSFVTRFKHHIILFINEITVCSLLKETHLSFARDVCTAWSQFNFLNFEAVIWAKDCKILFCTCAAWQSQAVTKSFALIVNTIFGLTPLTLNLPCFSE